MLRCRRWWMKVNTFREKRFSLCHVTVTVTVQRCVAGMTCKNGYSRVEVFETWVQTWIAWPCPCPWAWDAVFQFVTNDTKSRTGCKYYGIFSSRVGERAWDNGWTRTLSGEIFITGQIKENLNQIFSRYTRCKYKDLVLEKIFITGQIKENLNQV